MLSYESVLSVFSFGFGFRYWESEREVTGMEPGVKQTGRARAGLRAVRGGLVMVRPVMVCETMTSSLEIMKM